MEAEEHFKKWLWSKEEEFQTDIHNAKDDITKSLARIRLSVIDECISNHNASLKIAETKLLPTNNVTEIEKDVEPVDWSICQCQTYREVNQINNKWICTKCNRPTN